MSYQDLTNQVQNLVETNSALVTEVSRVRDSAMGLLRLYPTITAGREASAIGQYFSVPGNGAFVRLYQKTSASQQDLIAEYPTIDVFEGALTQAQQDADRSTTEADRAVTEANRSRDEADRAYQEYLNAQNVVVTNGTTLFDLDVATSVQPTLSSNFSRNKHERYEMYGNEPKTLLQQWDVDRNSTATYIDANGVLQTAAPHQPRIDYSTGEGRLLVEEQRTNLVPNSRAFGGLGYDVVGASVTLNAATDPMGGGEASRVVFDAGNSPSGPRVERDILNAGFSTPVVQGIFLRSDTDVGKEVIIGVLNTGTQRVTLESEWRFYTMTGQSSGVSGNAFPRVANGSGEEIECYAWGLDLQKGAYPTSHIPTTTSAVTRVADIITPKGDA